MEVTRSSISDVVGFPSQVVKSWYISVETLMNAKEPEEVSWGRVGCCAALAFPERGVKVVATAENGAFTNVETLC